jgi:hypothetical protein
MDKEALPHVAVLPRKDATRRVVPRPHHARHLARFARKVDAHVGGAVGTDAHHLGEGVPVRARPRWGFVVAKDPVDAKASAAQ